MIAESIGMTKIAQYTGLSGPGLYKALSEEAKPKFETKMKVMKEIGRQIQINPLTSQEMSHSDSSGQTGMNNTSQTWRNDVQRS